MRERVDGTHRTAGTHGDAHRRRIPHTGYGGAEFTASVVIAASGMFGNPHRPNIPALNTYTGKVMHSADYRPSEAFAGQRVVVIGSGNSAFQIAVELASHAEVILASRTCCGMRPPSRFRLIPGSGVTASLTNR
ncbi:NAD(P)-binding domain-containing protein [Nocardia cyriacigeorgica]|uniref:NAD(P)-binding domain-containing protein n=1 Tax=Nocardia cyriacigeorgica TaxID=135487 RepID=UPI002B4AE596|nr:NAD(P)-binding domain-containing protein [Nocardia cyriacigeorgica]